MDERVYLKVKVKSLAEEAKIIRKEEKRNKELRNGLAAHRKGVVRYEARHSQLAYGFLRGLPYEKLEHKDSAKVDWDKVKKMVDKYGAHWDSATEPYKEFEKRKKEVMERFENWRPGQK